MGSIPSYLQPELASLSMVLGCVQVTKRQQSLTQGKPTPTRGSSLIGKGGKTKKTANLQPEVNEPLTTTATARKSIAAELEKPIPEPVQDVEGPSPKLKKRKKKGKSAVQSKPVYLHQPLPL